MDRDSKDSPRPDVATRSNPADHATPLQDPTQDAERQSPGLPPDVEQMTTAGPNPHPGLPTPDAARPILRKILRKTGKAVIIYDMIHEGNRILVALSGGKDSWTALDALVALRRRAPVSFDIAVVHVHGGVSTKAYEEALDKTWQRLDQMGLDSYLVHTDVITRATAMGSGGGRCFLCARFRRGVLYRVAPQLGYDTIVLGHHADDLIETLMLNLMFTGQIKSMPPKLRSDDGGNTVLRPLCLVSEHDTASYARAAAIPVVPSPCGTCDPNTKRAWVKNLLTELDSKHPGTKGYLLAALQHVRPSHLADPSIHDFDF